MDNVEATADIELSINAREDVAPFLGVANALGAHVSVTTSSMIGTNFDASMRLDRRPLLDLIAALIKVDAVNRGTDPGAVANALAKRMDDADAPAEWND